MWCSGDGDSSRSMEEESDGVDGGDGLQEGGVFGVDGRCVGGVRGVGEMMRVGACVFVCRRWVRLA